MQTSKKAKTRLRVLFFLVLFLQSSLSMSQEEEWRGLSRRSFLRGMLSAGAAATVTSPMAVLGGLHEGLPFDLSESKVIEIMKDIFERHANPHRIVDIENYIREMKALADVAGPHMRQIVLGEVARVETHIARIQEISDLGNLPGSSLSSSELDKLKGEMKTPDGERILSQLSSSNVEYNMFVVRSMLPPDLIRTINHGLSFSGNMGDFLSYSELILVYDYGKIMAALQAKVEPGSRLHVMADNFLEMFDVSESRGISGYREAPAMFCSKIYRMN